MMRGPCERCGDGDDRQPLHRQKYGDPTYWDKMVCARCLHLPPTFDVPTPPEGCNRCGSFHELKITILCVQEPDFMDEPAEVEVRLCGDCRAAAHRENIVGRHA